MQSCRWFEIYVQDIDRVRTFYQNTFQVTLERLDSPELEMWMFPGQPDNSGCLRTLAKMPGKDSGGGGTLINFSCADCAVEAARAAQNGGQVFKEKVSNGEYGFIALIFDTEGNMVWASLHAVTQSDSYERDDF